MQNSMENRRRKTSSSGDKFSFPAIIPPAGQDTDQFEFGFVTAPGSPNSPADHLFYKGKLLPHVFPIQTTNNFNFSYSRSTSRTSSKDSLMSSRSNSTNSRSSNCSSARTSYSEYSNSERRNSSANRNILPGRPSTGRKDRNRPVLSYQYQWQLIAAAPVLKHQGSKSRKVEINGSKKKCEETKSWFGRRILKSFISTCKECHAITTSSAEESLPRSVEF